MVTLSPRPSILLGMLGLGDNVTIDPMQTIMDIIQGQATETPSTGLLESMLSVLTGTASELQLESIAQLMGISTKPIPNPLEDPFGFLTHHLVYPVILAALIKNPLALMVAKASLAGGVLLQSILS